MKNPSVFRIIPFRDLLPTALLLLMVAAALFLYLLPSIEKTYIEERKASIKEMTGTVVKALGHMHDRAQKGELTLEEAQTAAHHLVKSMRYGPDNQGYFWINDTTPRIIMHPYRPDLEGTIVDDLTDKNGKTIFQEFLKEAQKPEGGIVAYFWQWKDQPDTQVQKFSYVRSFKPWGWIIGTGFYLDDVNTQMAEVRTRTATVIVIIMLFISLVQFHVTKRAVLAEKKKTKVMEQRRKLMKAIQQSEERYRTIADFAHDWEVWISTEDVVLYCSPSCERITGYPPEHFVEGTANGRNIVLDEDKEAWDTYIERASSTEGDSLDFRIITKDGEERWLNAVGRPVFGIAMKPLGIRLSFRDITDRKNMEEQLRYQALHDPLTGLANRTLCLDRISQAMRRSRRRENYFFAVIFVDLDRFKIINDSLGHRFGDLVLKESANRLTDHVRTLDTVSRFGGDEFVLLLDELSSPGEAIRIIKRIREKMEEPFVFGGTNVQTTASFGIVLSPIGEAKPADVLQRANIAMHRAKDTGRNRFKVFTSRMLDNAVDQLTMENDMRRGLKAREFHIAYQPIMDIVKGDLVGFEALARWDHPERGPIPPAEFIPLAEESGAIIQLGEWVLQNALKTLAQWRDRFPEAHDVFMAVNLSTKQFARAELDKMVLSALKEVGLPPEALKLEVTESAIMDHPESAVRTLNNLRDAGVRFSIDDFGTGYSSLSQLQQLPVDTIKVDRSFITRMKKDPENMEIVKAVIALAHSLDLEVVAEGVELPEQLCSLVELECECVQGFYLHKPLSGDDAAELLRHKDEGSDQAPSRSMAKATEGC